MFKPHLLFAIALLIGSSQQNKVLIDANQTSHMLFTYKDGNIEYQTKDETKVFIKTNQI